MEEYIVYLFYLAVLLILGILITAITSKLKLSNILFLVLAGYALKLFNFNYFSHDIVIVLSSLTLILIVLETTVELDLSHIMKNFFQVFKFTIVNFVITAYIMTLLVFQVFDIPGKGFEVFVLCFLLSIIIYGVDPIIAMEFFKTKKNKIREMLEIEGMISGPIVVVFSFFVIDYLGHSVTVSFVSGVMGQMLVIVKQLIFAVIIGGFLAVILYKLLKNFEISYELSSLLMIAVGISVYVAGEVSGTNGSLAVVFYGILLKGLLKEKVSKKYTSMFAHTLYIIVFILFGIEFFFLEYTFWLKAFLLFLAYLLLRFCCIFLLIKNITIREKLFMTLNVAKGIEVAIVMFIMKLHFSSIEGIELILGLGFVFFILSYVLSTIVNHFSDVFLVHRR